MKRKCNKCDEKAAFFHSKCCNAHFEGVITDKGELQVVCEKCKKYVATIFDPQKHITRAEAELLYKNKGD